MGLFENSASEFFNIYKLILASSNLFLILCLDGTWYLRLRHLTE